MSGILTCSQVRRWRRLDVDDLQNFYGACAGNGADEILVVVVWMVRLHGSPLRRLDRLLRNFLPLLLMLLSQLRRPRRYHGFLIVSLTFTRNKHVLNLFLGASTVAVLVKDYLRIGICAVGPLCVDFIVCVSLVLDHERALIRKIHGCCLLMHGWRLLFGSFVHFGTLVAIT